MNLRTAPLVEMLRTGRRQIALGAGCMIGTGTLGYIVSLYVLSYTTGPLKLDRNTILTFTLISVALWMILTPWASNLADRVGRSRVLMGGGVGLTVGTAILFPLLDTANYPLILLAMLVVAAFVGITYGPIASLLADLFDPRVRYSGTSLAYQIGTILGGGLAPTVATALFASSGSSFTIAVYLTALPLISLASVAAVSRTQLGGRCPAAKPAPAQEHS